MGNAVDSKQKILNVAKKIFAEKGFDGARVSEIAEEAGVNKALIYYYFDSKGDILESLFKSLIDDFVKLLNNMMQVDEITEDDFEQVANIILDYILGKEDILRIAMTESLKPSFKQSIILKISEMLMNAEIDEMKNSFQEKGMGFPDNVKELYVAEFFTGLLPFINYILFKDEFIDYFNISEEEYREYFIKAFKQTHVAFHLKR